MAALALRGLKLTQPDSAVGFDEAVVLGKHGTNQHSAEKGGSSNRRSSLVAAGTRAAYTLARLKRDRPDLAEKVVSGACSANKAAIEAGFRAHTVSVKPTVEGLLDFIQKHLSTEERREIDTTD